MVLDDPAPLLGIHLPCWQIPGNLAPLLADRACSVEPASDSLDLRLCADPLGWSKSPQARA
jgi:hypothetical protein